MAGITLAAPATLAIGLVMGRRQQRYEKKRQLADRQQLAKQTYRKYVDAVTFTATKQSRDTLRLIHRELRDQWLGSLERAATVDRGGTPAAEHASRAAAMQRDERLADIDAELLVHRDAQEPGARPRHGLARVSLHEEVRALGQRAAAAYVGRRRSLSSTRTLARLDQPLRVAIAGKVNPGKSTLLNALVGDHLAPTDARECTRVVTWYRDGPSNRRLSSLRKDGAPLGSARPETQGSSTSTWRLHDSEEPGSTSAGRRPASPR